jgi:hypothetical protein
LNKQEDGDRFHLRTRAEKLKVAWLCEKARDNIREMLSGENPQFAEYLTRALVAHGEEFEDRWNACGLLIPPKVKASQMAAMAKNPGLAIQRLMSPEHARQMTTNVRLLTFWREELPPKKEEHICYGERRIGGSDPYGDIQSQTIAALAFRACDDRSGTVAPKDLANLHIAIIRGRKREEVMFGPNAQQLINDLLDLSIPETALRLLFSRFDLPSEE